MSALRTALARGVSAVAALGRSRLPPRPDHPYLTGVHAPMREELTLTDLEVEGAIPPALQGRYLRIGPNPIAPDTRAHHWFIGDGMVHGVALGGGSARWYRNRWIRSQAVAKARGVPAAPGPRHVFDTVNTNVLAIDGATYALVEAGSYPVALADDLEGQRYDPFGGSLKGSFTAHPHRDPLTGEHHAIAYEGTDPGAIRHVVIRDGRVVREEPVPVRHGPSIHDCALTARFVVILDLPVTLSVRALLGGEGFPYRWNPAHAARVGLLPRAGRAADIAWLPVDPGYVFHVGNAFDGADGRVTLDVVAYDRMFAGEPGGPDTLPRGLERWTLDPAGGAVERRLIDAAPQEFPRIDERRFGREHRFLYTLELPAAAVPGQVAGTRVFKHDLATGAREAHDFGSGQLPGEFVFVPAHAAAAEDEGWLMGLVIDVPADTTRLAILDARDLGAPPVATVRIPHRVPPGFHGNWVPA